MKALKTRSVVSNVTSPGSTCRLLQCGAILERNKYAIVCFSQGAEVKY